MKGCCNRLTLMLLMFAVKRMTALTTLTLLDLTLSFPVSYAQIWTCVIGRRKELWKHRLTLTKQA